MTRIEERRSRLQRSLPNRLECLMTVGHESSEAAQRAIGSVLPARETWDGAGVKIRRSIGQRAGLYADPFLMLDEFGTDQPQEYIAGFPSHPHCGFETVTYLLEGKLRHEDHLGHQGTLESGGAQWMTAGRGIVHSEMPLQQEGRLRGFQLWINLPRSRKQVMASYRDLGKREIPDGDWGPGCRVRILSGKVIWRDRVLRGPLTSPVTEPCFADLELQPGAVFACTVGPDEQAVLYPYEGSLAIGSVPPFRWVPSSVLIITTPGPTVTCLAGPDGARALFLAAHPLGEPVVQYGPFVTNSQEEMETVLTDYQNGHFPGP